MFCRRHSYSGRRSSVELLTRLREAPRPSQGISPETLTEIVRAQVRLPRALLSSIADLDRALGAGLLEHIKAPLLAPMPRIGEVNLAQVIAEVGPVLGRARHVDQACALVGRRPRPESRAKDVP